LICQRANKNVFLISFTFQWTLSLQLQVNFGFKKRLKWLQWENSKTIFSTCFVRFFSGGEIRKMFYGTHSYMTHSDKQTKRALFVALCSSYDRRKIPLSIIIFLNHVGVTKKRQEVFFVFSFFSFLVMGGYFGNSGREDRGKVGESIKSIEKICLCEAS